MHKKATIIVCMLFLSGVLTIMPTTRGATIHVPEDYPTIQQAIDNASDGDTIKVAAGTYDVAIINVTKDNLTIQSLSGDPSDTIISSTVGNVSGITVYPMVNITDRNNVTISGFTITGTYRHYIYLKNSSNCSLSNLVTSGMWLQSAHNNTFNSIAISPATAYGTTVRGSCGNSFTSITVSDFATGEFTGGFAIDEFSDENTFETITISNLTSGFQAMGFYLIAASNNSFTNCDISDLTCTSSSAAAMGIYLQYECNNNTFNSIDISNVVGKVQSIGIYEKLGSNDNIFGSIEISDLTATDADGRSMGVHLGKVTRNNFHTLAISGMTGGLVDEGGWGISLYYSECHDNIFSGYDISNLAGANNYGICIRGAANNNLFNGGSISGADIGIYVKGDCPSHSIHYTNITGNTEGASSDTVTVNATYNYWGDASGPYHAVNHTSGQGDSITDYVDFTPWYADEDLTGLYLEVGEEEELQDVLDDASDGDTIIIGERTIEADIVIDKDVIIKGEGKDVTKIDGKVTVSGDATVLNLSVIDNEIHVLDGATCTFSYVRCPDWYLGDLTDVTIDVNSSNCILQGISNSIDCLCHCSCCHTCGTGGCHLMERDMSVTVSAGDCICMNITEWTGNIIRKWTATSTGDAVLSHRIGGLKPTTSYTVAIDGQKSVYNTDADGELEFVYSGGWSTHMFTVCPVGIAPTQGGARPGRRPSRPAEVPEIAEIPEAERPDTLIWIILSVVVITLVVLLAIEIRKGFYSDL